jgi:hypothetical protein
LAIGKCWDVIDPDELNPWMADFVTIRVPNGESFTDLHSRVVDFIQSEFKYAFETSDYCSSPGMSEAFYATFQHYL